MYLKIKIYKEYAKTIKKLLQLFNFVFMAQFNVGQEVPK